MQVGRTKYGAAGIASFTEYAYGGTAITVASEDGEPLYRATVFMDGHVLPPDEVWIKDWSENEGVADALVKAGIVTLTGRTLQAGYATALHAKLTPAAIAAQAF